MARILVTGARGFVGPHLLRRLLAEGHEVWGTDRTDAAEAPQQRACDLTDADAVRTLCDDLRPEAVVHLASVSLVGRSFATPQLTLQNNLLAACNVFEALRGRPATRVLVIGSAEQYGRVPPEDMPIAEAQPFRPSSPYAVSKVAQEVLALQYHTTYGLDVVLVRSFNHSGPGQSERRIAAAARAGRARLCTRAPPCRQDA